MACGGFTVSAKHSRIITSTCQKPRLRRLLGAPPGSENGRRCGRTTILPSVRPAARAAALRTQRCRLLLKASSDGARQHRALALAQPCMQDAAAAEAPSCAAPDARCRGCQPSTAGHSGADCFAALPTAALEQHAASVHNRHPAVDARPDCRPRVWGARSARLCRLSHGARPAEAPRPQAVMLVSAYAAYKADALVARQQRRELGLCEACGGLNEPATCTEARCPCRAAGGRGGA